MNSHMTYIINHKANKVKITTLFKIKYQIYRLNSQKCSLSKDVILVK